jgi:hypothetical protein
VTTDDAGDTAEYDWHARATVEAITVLGHDVAIAAACRGTASPAALDWLIDRLDGHGRLLDVGGGLGGPSAYVRASAADVEPIVLEPAPYAAYGARALFGIHAVIGRADDCAFHRAAFANVWALGTLSATEQPAPTLTEMWRVTQRRGRLGLLEYVSTGATRREPQLGNTFLSRDDLRQCCAETGWSVLDETDSAQLFDTPAPWQADQAQVEALIDERYRGSDVLQRVNAREGAVTHLIESGAVTPVLLVAERDRVMSRSATTSTPPTLPALSTTDD